MKVTLPDLNIEYDNSVHFLCDCERLINLGVRHAQKVFTLFPRKTLRGNCYVVNSRHHRCRGISCFPFCFFCAQLIEHNGFIILTKHSHLTRVEISVVRNNSFIREKCPHFWIRCLCGPYALRCCSGRARIVSVLFKQAIVLLCIQHFRRNTVRNFRYPF